MEKVFYLNQNNTLIDSYNKYIIEMIDNFKINNNGKIPSKKEMLALGVSVKPLIDTFGGWKKSLIGLGIVKSNESISIKLFDLKDKLERIPTLLDLKNADISINSVIKEYGSWSNAKKVLNGKENIPTASKIENDIIELVKDINKVPTVKDIKEAKINIKPILNKYSSWSNAKKILNIENYIKEEKKILISNEEIQEIKNEILSIQNKLKRKPNLDELKNENIDIKKLLKSFGSWNKAYESLNLQDNLINIYKAIIVEKSRELGRIIRIKELKEYDIQVSILTSNQKWSEIVEELKLNEIEKDSIKDKIIKISKELGYRPLMSELLKNKIEYTKVIKDYDSISDMYDKLGVPKNKVNENVDLSEIILKIKLLKEILGETPSLEQVINNKIKVRKAIKVYGTWRNFLKANDLIEDVSIDDIVKEVKDLANELGHTPSISELKNKGIKYYKLQHKYGSYNKALLEMGLSINKIVSDEDEEFIISQIKNLYKNLGYAPSIKELKDNNIKIGGILSKYKGINNLYKELGIIQKSEIISKDELMNQLNEIFSKLNKFPSISEAKKQGMNIGTVKTYFSSWKKFEIEFNMNNRNNRIENSKKLFIELSIELEKAPTIEEAKEYGINPRDLITHYKGWRNVCNALYEESKNNGKEAI